MHFSQQGKSAGKGKVVNNKERACGGLPEASMISILIRGNIRPLVYGYLEHERINVGVGKSGTTDGLMREVKGKNSATKRTEIFVYN